MYGIKDLKVKIKLVCTFLLVAFLVCIVGIIGMNGLKTTSNNSEEMYNNNLQSVYIMTDVKQNLTEVQLDIQSLLFIKDSSQKSKLEENIKKIENENNNYFKKYENLRMTDTEKETYKKFKEQLQSYRDKKDSIIKLIDEEKYTEAYTPYSYISKQGDTLLEQLDALITDNLNSAKTANDNNHSIFIHSNATMLVIMILGIAISVLLGLVITLDITKPLSKIKMFADSISNYDFSTEWNIVRKDEFGQTISALANAQKKCSQPYNRYN